MNFVLINMCCFFVIFSSVCVVTSKNALHSIVFLVFTFLFSAFTIFSLENEFLALFFVIIYLGAILILFVFVVMMLDLKHNVLNTKKVHLPIGVVPGLISLFYMSGPLRSFFLPGQQLPLTSTNQNIYVNWKLLVDQNTDIEAFSGIFYQNYAAQIILSGLLLYIAVIGVVFLTSNKRSPSSVTKNNQSLTRQLSRTNVL